MLYALVLYTGQVSLWSFMACCLSLMLYYGLVSSQLFGLIAQHDFILPLREMPQIHNVFRIVYGRIVHRSGSETLGDAFISAQSSPFTLRSSPVPAPGSASHYRPRASTVPCQGIFRSIQNPKAALDERRRDFTSTVQTSFLGQLLPNQCRTFLHMATSLFLLHCIL